jgi:trehalose synthase
VFSSPKFVSPVKIPQYLICPAIDPLNDKNRQLGEREIAEILHRFGIDREKPILLQVARYDYLKDPIGLLEAFKLVKRYIDCQLILAGDMPKDPESQKVLDDIRNRAEGIPDVHILLLTAGHNDIEINALQRAASVVVQKSIKDNFCLAVTEALWKNKPVVASSVGGIPLQIKHKYSGLLCHSVEGAALHIRQFLHNPAFAARLAHNGKTHATRNFLITRLISEQMLLALSMFYPGDVITLSDNKE